MEFMAKVALGLFLVYVSLAVLIDLLQRPQVQIGVFIIAILVGLLWWLWLQLPEWFRKIVWRSKRKEHERER